jgi:hypothetical protein
MSKSYEIERRPSGVHVLITDGRRPLADLSPRFSQKIRNHSPDGFEVGYPGSGPAQLALAILIDFLTPGTFTAGAMNAGVGGYPTHIQNALALYQQFKADFIAGERRDHFTIDGAQIEAWLATQQVAA